jgi:hypothetical protein
VEILTPLIMKTYSRILPFYFIEKISIVFLISLFSCTPEQPKKEVSEQELRETLTSFLLEDKKELIRLLSLSKQINYDTLYGIIKFYSENTIMNEKNIDSTTIITVKKLSEKYAMPTNQIASIILNYKGSSPYCVEKLNFGL